MRPPSWTSLGWGMLRRFAPPIVYVYMFPGVSPGEAATMICALSGALSEHAWLGTCSSMPKPPTLMLNI